MSTYQTIPATSSTAWQTVGNTMVSSMAGLDAGPGGAADDTAAVQAQITALASSPGGGVLLGRPNTTYTVLDVTVPSNVVIAGHGWSTIFRTPAGTADNHTLFSFTGSSTAASGNVVNAGVRDCQLLGTVATDGFVQHRHLVVLGGVTYFRASNVLFKGFQGDGIYMGHIGGNERHNLDVTIEGSCVFDGVNQDNRNAVSVIDCDGLDLDGTFLNCTRQGQASNNMPGPIDVEPNSGTTWPVLRNIRIRGRFRNCRASTGLVTVALQPTQAALATPSTGIVIGPLTAVDCPNANATLYLFQNQTPSATTRKNNIEVSKVVAYNSGRPFELRGVRGVSLADSHFENCWGAGTIGFDGLCRDVAMRGVTFDTISGSNGLEVYRVNDLSIVDTDWISAGSAQLLRFGVDSATTGASDRVDLVDARIRGTVPTAVVLKDAAHTVTSTSNNRAFLNRWGGSTTTALTNVFAAGNTANNL